jgi:hypothetical protein
MSGQSGCWRYQPSLEELLADEIMVSVLRSAGLDRQGVRDMIEETARRLDDREPADDRDAEPEIG